MTDPVVRGRRNPLLGIALIGLAIVAAIGVKLGYDRYTERYTVERTDDGAAITRIVAARFAGASALKVGSLSGTVQSTASDVSGYGMLRADKVVKAPFTVDYFIDVSKLTARDLRWDATSRTLVVAVPDVSVGPANVDEAARTLSQTRGVFVTRDAADRLGRTVSQRAQVAAAGEARRPERLALARDHARKALGGLLGVPLDAAGFPGVTVVLRFPWEGARDGERWDRSRNLTDVAANRF